MLGKKGQNQFTKGTWTTHPPAAQKRLRELWLGRKHTPESKARISASMKRFFTENPDRAGYALNHYSKGASYPERYWRECLENAGVTFEAEYPLGSYRLDFGFPDTKVDLEIDGNQHQADPRIVKHDKVRDLWVTRQGWKVIRVSWPSFRKLSHEARILRVSEVLLQVQT